MIRLRTPAFYALVAASAVLAVADPGLLAVFGPAIALFALLLRGVRPGEATLVRMLRARRSRPRVRVPRLAPPRLPLVVRPAGRLIASALAMRPPPTAAALQLS